MEKLFECVVGYLKYADIIYSWSFSEPRHDVPRFLLAQKRREETKDVFIASKMRPNLGCLQAIWVSGSFKRKEKKAQIKNLRTPLIPNFKILGGALPQGQDLIDACSLYALYHCGWCLVRANAIVGGARSVKPTLFWIP